MKSKFLTQLLYVSLSISSLLSSYAFADRSTVSQVAPQIAPVPKPLQIVTLAFDGSEDKIRWEQTRQFAKQYPVKFTYFVSGVMFIGRTKSVGSSDDKGITPYWAPEHHPGNSDIGFSAYQAGNTIVNQPLIIERITEMNEALAEGHEIGSHLNGHFGSYDWKAPDWQQEFDDFWKLLFEEPYTGSRPGEAKSVSLSRKTFLYGVQVTARKNSGPYDPLKDKNAIVGFRAPLLAYTPEMYPVLGSEGFLYDTSRTSQQNYWPEKMTASKNGVVYPYWNFPLAQIDLAGCVGGPHGRVVFDISKFTPDSKGNYPETNIYVVPSAVVKGSKTQLVAEEQCDTLTMDYNLLVSQSPAANRNAPLMLTGKTEDEQRLLKLFENQIVDTYRTYFKSNYNGNRAPIEIGHHFALWNNGIYWNAMQRLAREVCVLSDVRCIKYKDLMQYMEGLTPAELAAYRAGRFTNQVEVQLNLAKGDHNTKKENQRGTASTDSKIDADFTKCMSKFNDSLCYALRETEEDSLRSFQHVASRLQHLRLRAEEQRERIDLDSLHGHAADTYAWLTSEKEKAHVFLDKMISFTKEELKEMHPSSHALDCEGGSSDCVEHINDRVLRDRANHKDYNEQSEEN